MTETHWVVVRTCNFTGREHVVERRKTRNGAYRAMNSCERYVNPDEFLFWVMRSDEAVKKGIT